MVAAPCREQLQELSLYRSFTLEEKHCCSYYSNRVIDEHLKRQIKNRTLCTCRSFLITRIFQYIGNWSKVTEYLSTLFLQYAQSNNFSQFFYIKRFSVDYAGLHINWAVTSLFIYHSWYISNFETSYKKRPFIKVAFFSDVV